MTLEELIRRMEEDERQWKAEGWVEDEDFFDEDEDELDEEEYLRIKIAQRIINLLRLEANEELSLEEINTILRHKIHNILVDKKNEGPLPDWMKLINDPDEKHGKVPES